MNLAADIQEQILFLPPTIHGRDPIRMGHVLPIAQTLEWQHQRALWHKLIAKKCPHIMVEVPEGCSPEKTTDGRLAHLSTTDS